MKDNCLNCGSALFSGGKVYCTEHNIELKPTFDAWGEPAATSCELFVETEDELDNGKLKKEN